MKCPCLRHGPLGSSSCYSQCPFVLDSWHDVGQKPKIRTRSVSQLRMHPKLWFSSNSAGLRLLELSHSSSMSRSRARYTGEDFPDKIALQYLSWINLATRQGHDGCRQATMLCHPMRSIVCSIGSSTEFGTLRGIRSDGCWPSPLYAFQTSSPAHVHPAFTAHNTGTVTPGGTSSLMIMIRPM